MFQNIDDKMVNLVKKNQINLIKLKIIIIRRLPAKMEV